MRGWLVAFPTIEPPTSVIRRAWGVTREAVVQWTIVVALVVALALSDAALWSWLAVLLAVAQVTMQDTSSRPRGLRKFRPIYLSMKLGSRGGLAALQAVLLGLVTAVGIHEPRWRLFVLIVGVSWIVTKTSARLAFTLWSASGDSAPKNAMASLSLFYGAMLVLVACGLSYLREWPRPERWLPIAVAVAGFTMSWHVAQAKLAYFGAEDQSRRARLDGRDAILADVHSVLSSQLRDATTRAFTFREQSPELLNSLRVLRVQLDSLGSRPTSGQTDDEALLAETVRTTAAMTGAVPRVHIDVPALHPDDFGLARNVLGDLTFNAVEADATELVVRVVARGRIEISVTDNARGFSEGKFRKAGSSLDRLGRLIESRGGFLTASRQSTTTTVSAFWNGKAPDSLGHSEPLA